MKTLSTSRAFGVAVGSTNKWTPQLHVISGFIKNFNLFSQQFRIHYKLFSRLFQPFCKWVALLRHSRRKERGREGKEKWWVFAGK